MQQSSPRVSIGLPVYNGARYLACSIESILEQDLEDFELIVSDNGSTDATPEICQEFAERDPRVRLFRQERNLGASWNFEEVFRLSKAPYFKWAAHDDWCAPSHLRRCLEVFEESPESVVLVYPRTVLVSETGEATSLYRDELDIRDPRPHRRVWHLIRWLALCNAVLGVIRRDALERSSRIAPYAGADRVLLAELALQGEFREVPEYLFYRRRHAGSSREANQTAQDVYAWFDPAARADRAPQLRLAREHLASIWRAPHAWGERVLCSLAYVFGHTYKRVRVALGTARRRFLGRTGRTRSL